MTHDTILPAVFNCLSSIRSALDPPSSNEIPTPSTQTLISLNDVKSVVTAKKNVCVSVCISRIFLCLDFELEIKVS